MLHSFNFYFFNHEAGGNRVTNALVLLFAQTRQIIKALV